MQKPTSTPTMTAVHDSAGKESNGGSYGNGSNHTLSSTVVGGAGNSTHKTTPTTNSTLSLPEMMMVSAAQPARSSTVTYLQLINPIQLNIIPLLSRDVDVIPSTDRATTIMGKITPAERALLTDPILLHFVQNNMHLLAWKYLSKVYPALILQHRHIITTDHAADGKDDNDHEFTHNMISPSNGNRALYVPGYNTDAPIFRVVELQATGMYLRSVQLEWLPPPSSSSSTSASCMASDYTFVNIADVAFIP